MKEKNIEKTERTSNLEIKNFIVTLATAMKIVQKIYLFDDRPIPQQS